MEGCKENNERVYLLSRLREKEHFVTEVRMDEKKLTST